MATTRVTTLVVNGTSHTVDIDPARDLLGVLRDDLHLTGTKYGCGEGQCGACVVLVGGTPTPACSTPVAEIAGRPILTIEGLAQGEQLHPVQQAFLDEEALQCGYCTPGMIMAAVALLETDRDPNEETIIGAMDKHICRCGTYARVMRAIRAAALASRETAVVGGAS
jgi:aerobic-type carbon monoxide dehydrogenase small subunit (CoxS/CutS family)